MDLSVLESSVDHVKKNFMDYLRGKHKNSRPLDLTSVFKLESDTGEGYGNNDDRTKYYFINNSDEDGIYFFISANAYNEKIRMKNIFTNETNLFGPETRFTHIDLNGHLPLDLKYKTLLKYYDADDMEDMASSGGKSKKTKGKKKPSRSKKQTRKGKKVTKRSKTLTKKRMRIRNKSSKKYNK